MTTSLQYAHCLQLDECGCSYSTCKCLVAIIVCIFTFSFWLSVHLALDQISVDGIEPILQCPLESQNTHLANTIVILFFVDSFSFNCLHEVFTDFPKNEVLVEDAFIVSLLS